MKLIHTKLLKENKQSILENVKQGKMYVDKGQLDPDILKKIILIDPTPTRKYVGWMAKQWVLGNTSNIDSLRNTIEEFNTFLERGRVRTKDINQFKTFQDLVDEVDSVNQTGAGLSSKDLESDYEVIVDTPDLLIMTPHSHEASRKLGLSHFRYRKCQDGSEDSAWCTTYKAPDHFNTYYFTNGVTFYYIRVRSEAIRKQLLKRFGNNKGSALAVTAIAVTQDGKMDGYDGLDEQIRNLRSFLNILNISNQDKILVPRRSKEERIQARRKAINNAIRKYTNGGKGDLNLRNADTINKLPDSIKRITGNLDISKSTISQLPENMVIEGSLTMESMKNFTLPKGLVIKQGLNAENCTNLTFPDDIRISGDLNLNLCTFSRIPDSITELNNLYITSTPTTYIHSNLTIKENFKLGPEAVILPEGFKVGGDMLVFKGDKISFPKNLWVGRDLVVGSKKSLPENLYVGRNLRIEYDIQFLYLPDNITVGNNLDLSYNYLNELPENLNVRGNLILKQCTILKKYNIQEILSIIKRQGGSVGGEIIS